MLLFCLLFRCCTSMCQGVVFSTYSVGVPESDCFFKYFLSTVVGISANMHCVSTARIKPHHFFLSPLPDGLYRLAKTCASLISFSMCQTLWCILQKQPNVSCSELPQQHNHTEGSAPLLVTRTPPQGVTSHLKLTPVG